MTNTSRRPEPCTSGDPPEPHDDDPVVACRAFELTAARQPTSLALVQGEEQLTYGELNDRANRLAAHLAELGVTADDRVAIHLPNGIDAVVAALGVLKSGAAYVPVDPSYPAARFGQVLGDADPLCIITVAPFEPRLPATDAAIVRLDADGAAIAQHSGADVDRSISMSSLAYVIFTSGSTGRPKGVMVEHGNLANFLAGMDARVPHTPPGRLLSVTSLAFDISVLEIVWTLVNGFEVVFEPGFSPPQTGPAAASAERPISFSLCYFGADDGTGEHDHIRLLMDGARFADRHGFEAIWTPERHFHAFGANHPNPAVTSATLAAVTERVALRAGSVVLPLHHPARVAEEWALVDNLSGGRVGVSFASGWQPADFVLRPDAFDDRRRVTFDGIETVRRLWRGDVVPFRDPAGADRDIRTMPRPIQPELPVWVTAAGDPETFRAAGTMGANVLTHLLGQTVDELAEKIGIYRAAWREHGHEPGDGKVSLMVHTFVDADDEAAHDRARGPIRDYVARSLSLIDGADGGWAALKRRHDGTTAGERDIVDLDPEERAELLDFATERFIDHSGLFGTPGTCLNRVSRFRDAGVDEVACLIDFGLATDDVLDSLGHLDELRRRSQGASSPAGTDRIGRIGDLLVEHSITHLQCVPSMARALVEGDTTRAALRNLDVLLVGGERFAGDLAARLQAATSASIHNMYGPTETTIWSSTEPVDAPDGDPSIGRPILNTTFHVLDERRQPVASGEEGELWIGGDGVARGYIARPDLTTDQFVPDPFDERESRRLYRTGDLVRRRDDGRFDIIGRTDHQVKIRGNRVELGEIETLLHQHGSVRQATVLAIDVSSRDRRLVGFVTPRDGARLDVDDLRSFLARSLPDYMVPAAIVAIDELPLTPNGKIDRKALVAGSWNTRREIETTAPPTGSIEQTIARIWQKVLRSGAVDAHDNFFDLGGHSLVAIEAHHLLEQALDRRVAITDLLRYPTVRLLAEHLGGPATEIEPSCSTAAPPDGDGMPLSFVQERVWVIDQLDPGSTAYHDGFTIDIGGPIDDDTLRHSLAVLVDRHEILRTSFPVRDGQPVQAVAASIELPFSVLDLRHEPPPQRRERLAQHTEQLADLPFDLSSGPLVRASLVRLDDHEHVLVLVFHHAVIDGASVTVLLDELAVAYDALQQGEVPALPPIAAPYGDFASRQRRAAEAGDPSHSLAFWTGYLDGVDRPASVPATNGTESEHRAGRCTLTLDRAATAALRRLAREADVTPFIAFLAAFGALVHRMSSADRLSVGSPVAERGVFGSSADIGPFLNVLPLRIDATGDPTIRELLDRVRDDVLAALDHREIPFQQIVRHLGAHHDPAGSSLFAAIINYEPSPPASASAGATTFTIGTKPVGSARVPLELYVDDFGDRATLRLLYSLERYDDASGRALLDALGCLIETAVASPDQPISRIPLASEEARRFVPALDVARPTEPFVSVPELVAEQARRDPHGIAVVGHDQTLTYEQLDSWATTIACRIYAAELGSGDVVAICGSRSVELVAAMLGVLRSGAVLLLLDPDLPVSRRDRMSQEAKVSLTIDLSDGATSLAVGADTEIGTVDLARAGADDPAYVVFTSGSTGRPKAVVGRHRGLSHFVRWQRDTFGIGAGDRCAQLTSPSFDVILRDVFTPLISGAELHLPPAELTLIASEVLPWLRDSGITMLHTVPSLASFWANRATDIALGDLRLVFFAGEPLHDTVVERWRALTRSDPTIVNLYGPTETTLATCWHVVPPDPVAGVQPIGRPIPGAEVWVSQHDLTQPSGIGEPGEIVIRSPYRTAGYLDDAAGEPPRFIPNPMSADPDDLVYRTGDIGVLGPDGTISYRGRRDDQIKIRGQRVEPGEIEAALVGHVSVAECAVVVDGGADETQLVAYVTSTGGDRLEPTELRRHLARELPAGYLPNAFVSVDELPRLASGKIDRRTLSAEAPPAREPDREHTDEPVTPLERQLAGIWAEVLGRRPIGRHDDFFEIGGHSLLAFELAARIEDDTGRTFPVSMLLRAPTVELQARKISDATHRAGPTVEPRPTLGGGLGQFYVPGRDDGILRLSDGESVARLPLLLIPGRGEHPIRFRHLADALGHDRPVHGIVHPLESASGPAPTIETIATRIRDEITHRGFDGPVCLGGYSSGAVIAYELAQQLAADDRDVAALVLIDPAVPAALAPRFNWTERKYLRIRQVLRRERRFRSTAEPFTRWWNQRLGRLDGQPTIGGDTTRAELEMMNEYHRRAAHTYRPEPYRGVVSVVRRELDERWYITAISAWLRLGNAGSNARAAHGDHLELLAPPQVDEVARYIDEWLGAADRDVGCSAGG